MAVALQNQTTEYDEIAKFFQADLGVQCIATKTNKWREFYSKNLVTEWKQAEDRNNVYWTANSFKSHNRSLSSIVQLNAFYVDLDCYKVGMTKEIALHALNMVLKDNNIFKPTMIIDSGNGLQLLWRIEGVPVRSMNIIKLWNRIEKELAGRLDILGADPASTDASRVLRVPETYNTKGKELQRTKVVSFDSKAIYEMRDFQFELLPALKNKTSEKRSNKTTKKGKVSHLFNIFTLNKARLRDLETLLVLRENDPENMRNIILFLMANFIENGSLEIDNQAYIEKVNSSLKIPLNHQELAIIARNTDGKYNYKNETLIELLQITEKEERHMKSILSKQEYNRRKRIAERERYEPIKKVNKKKKEKRDEQILAMIAEEYTHKEISDELNISTKTVQRVVKSSKNKANDHVKTDEVKNFNFISKTAQSVTNQPKDEVDIFSGLKQVYKWGGVFPRYLRETEIIKFKCKGDNIMTEQTLLEGRFFELLERDSVRKDDVERKALFYILASEGIYSKCDALYDFEEHWILPEGVESSDFSSRIEKMILLAFNLYNGHSAPDPLTLFSSLDDKNFDICMQAIQIRFNKKFYENR